MHRLRTNVEDVKAEVLFTYPVVCISYPCTSSSLKVWFLHQDDQPYFSVGVWLGDSEPSLHDNGPHHKHIGWFVRVHKGQSECLLQSNVHDLDRVVRQMPLVACLTRRTHVDGWLCKPCMPYWMSLRTRILLGLPLFRSIYRRLWLQFLRRVL